MDDIKQHLRRVAQAFIAKEMIRIATHGTVYDDPVKEERRKTAQLLCNRLCATEFKDLDQTVIVVLNDELKDETAACVYLEGRCNREFVAFIFLNEKVWERYPEWYEKKLPNTLRHELIHLLTKLFDDDPGFQEELKKRGLK